MTTPYRNPPVVSYPKPPPPAPEQPAKFWRPATWVLLCISLLLIGGAMGVGMALQVPQKWYFWASAVDIGGYNMFVKDALWGILPACGFMLLANLLAVAGCRQAGRSEDRTLIVLYMLLEGIVLLAVIAQIATIAYQGQFGVMARGVNMHIVFGPDRAAIATAGAFVLALPMWIILFRGLLVLRRKTKRRRPGRR